MLGAIGVSAAVGIAACSLGDAVTPSCDPAAGPNETNSCIEVSGCDDGKGSVKATDQCCMLVGNYLYGKCLGRVFDGDFRDECAPNSGGCCTGPLSNFDICMEGRYPVGSTETSSTTTTGSGGGGQTTGTGGSGGQ